MLSRINLSFKSNQDASPQEIYAKFININRDLPLAKEAANHTKPQGDVFVKNIENDTAQPSRKSLLLTVGGGIVAVGLAGIIALKSKKSARFAIALTTEQIGTFEKDMKAFPKDINYRKTILNDMGLKPEDYHRLRPIVGIEEFTSLVKDLNQNPQSYAPSLKKEYHPNGKVKFPKIKENVENFIYRANLHMHTINSDGQFTISEMIEQAVDYADKLHAKTGKNFIFAITDHDAVKGCKDAVDIIINDPWKYRNIRLALGIENTTLHKNEKLLKPDTSAHIHLLMYGINPHGKDFKNFLDPRLEKYQGNIKTVLQNANNMFKDVLEKNQLKYTFEDAAKVAPCFKSSIKHTGYMKDFLQLRLIYAHTVENNKLLTDFLKENRVELNSLDFVKGRDYIPPPEKQHYGNGQTYWGYYYDGLKKYIAEEAKKKNPQLDEKQLSGKFIEISPEVKNTLHSIESRCNDKNSGLHVDYVKYYSFTDTVSKLQSFEHGAMGMAHPGIIFPFDCMKNKADTVELFKDLFDIFKDKGKEKAVFSEDHYQVPWRDTDKKIIEALEKISSEKKLIKTGSLDTHGKSIFEE